MGDTRINDTFPEFRGIRFKLRFLNLNIFAFGRLEESPNVNGKGFDLVMLQLL